MMLMLPAANRLNKETLKMYQDSGAFPDFFPAEDNFQKQAELLNQVPNLDFYGDKNQLGLGRGLQIKTSLGNTLRLIRPIIILDEGHKAYTEGARSTLMGFNPSFMLELSATPTTEANKLVEITGRELNDEEMIKLDIHLINKTSLDWKDTLLSAYEKRNQLEIAANTLRENSGTYIRPIMLIQVERTGADQRGGKYIHAEDAREFLVNQCNIPPDQVAVKSSDKDDIEGIDLLSEGSTIRYIITKQALQEGWDCPFAYVLTILTNPGSQTGITQLIGRVLRQPYARKTKVKELDECYVFTYRQNASALVKGIKSDLEKEGLGDIASHISANDVDEPNLLILEHETSYRQHLKKFEGSIYLPQFVVQGSNAWQALNYEIDILSRIDWYQADLTPVTNLSLKEEGTQEQIIRINLAKQENFVDEIGRESRVGVLSVNLAFMAQQLIDTVPNPFVAFELGKNSINKLRVKHSDEVISSNFIYIIEELKKQLTQERDRLAENVFRQLIADKIICFYLIKGEGGFTLPSRIKVKYPKRDENRLKNEFAKSLFDIVPEEGMNILEKTVALYIDEQERFLWWYRNLVGENQYRIQAWRKDRIYPDLLVGQESKAQKGEFDKVFVFETKGKHLKAFEDTQYKQNVFQLCNELAIQKAWTELNFDFPDRKFEFQMLHEDEWKEAMNKEQ
jgi:type III restriction enzyme